MCAGLMRVSRTESAALSHHGQLFCQAMVRRPAPAWAELIQLVPVISLAFPFILAGQVDLGRAGPAFLLAAVLAIVVSAVVVLRKHLLNPILVGTGAWLWAGALAHYLPIPALWSWLVATQAFGLFAAALLAGAITTLVSPWGYLAYRSESPSWNRKASLALLALTALAVAWAWSFRQDIRLGGGLPFIVLNVVRRLLGRAAPVRPPRAQS